MQFNPWKRHSLVAVVSFALNKVGIAEKQAMSVELLDAGAPSARG
jgi:hypothetical protein